MAGSGRVWLQHGSVSSDQDRFSSGRSCEFYHVLPSFTPALMLLLHATAWHFSSCSTFDMSFHVFPTFFQHLMQDVWPWLAPRES